MDRGRAEVYAAELTAFDGTDLETVRTVDEIRSVIAAIADGAWWSGPAVRVVARRSDAESSLAQVADGGIEIRLAAPQATWATAAHELAHALAGVEAGHGPRYRRAMLDIVDVLTNTAVGARRGRMHVDQLADAYAAAGLTVGERAWSRPAAGDPFAL